MNQPAPGEKRAIERKAPMTQQDRADFAGAAVRLRKNADKGNLGALWAESHRLTAAWQRHANAPGVKDSNGSGGSTGLVSALSHAARGGDTVNAAMLARRLADALEVAASHGGRRHAETEVAHHAAR